MNHRELFEDQKRGTFAFPLSIYHLTNTSPRYNMPSHWHYDYEMIRVKSGSFAAIFNGDSYILNPGDVAFVGSGVIHGGIPDNAKYECIVFDLEAIIRNSPISSELSERFLEDFSNRTEVFQKNNYTATIISQIFDAMSSSESGSEWSALGLIFQLTGQLINNRDSVSLKQTTSQVEKLKGVLRFIRDNYGEVITLDKLASLAGMSPRYFCRAFSSMTGKTPIQYLNYYRIETAGEKLRRTNNSITEIALSCGFNDMSYFSKMFLRQKGISPSKYRNKK
ncbi:MAG: helix-turn-helix transcriptional regulator [Oscillospiraceae bacterium]|nr:helix-turn-helix transcriptional regulator [Oscillospiraceae bacterium]